MTVKELIKQLQKFDGKCEVAFTVQDGNDDQIFVDDFGMCEDDGCVTIWGKE